MKPSVLFSHRISNVPIIQRLAEKNDYNIICLEGYDQDFLDKYDLEKFNDFINLDQTAPDITALSGIYASRMKQIVNSSEFSESLTKTFVINDKTAAKVGARFQKVTESILPGMFFHIMGFKNIIEQRDLRLLVIHDVATWQCRTLAATAQRHGIKVLHLPHAAGGALQNGYKGANKPNMNHDFVDLAIVSKEIEYQTLLQHGVPSSKLAPVGHPYTDGYVQFARDFYQNERQNRKTIWSRFGVDPGDLIVLYCTAWPNSTLCLSHNQDTIKGGFQTALESIRDLRRKTDRPVALVIKFHPNIKQIEGGPQKLIDWHRNYAQSQGFENCHYIFIPEIGIGLKELLAASDASLHLRLSTTVIEALLVRTMPVYLDEFPAENNVAWKKVVKTASRVEELPTMLKQAVELKHGDYWQSESFKRAAYDLTFNSDGRAGERVVRVIETMMEGRAMAGARPGAILENNCQPAA